MRVSVIVPCYNAAPYLGQALGSALAQSRSPDEVIVVDDGSTDGSPEIAESFGGCVRVVSERRGNAPETRNRGAALATGEALLFLDADDVLGPWAVEALLDTLRDKGGIAACSWSRLERVGGRWVRRPPSCAPRSPREDALSAWLQGWYHPPCSVLWTREAYEHTGGWDARARVNNDGDIMMRALALGIPLHVTTGGEAFYRRLPNGEASLSGRRFGPEGLKARVWVVRRVAEMLESQGRLTPYHGAFDVAFGRIALDCGAENPEIAESALRLRRQYGGPVWERLGRALHRRMRSRLPPLLQTSAPSPETPAGVDEEVTFGLVERCPPSVES